MSTASALDTFVTGSIVAARLARETLESFDPVLRPLLAGQQFFVKLADGGWHPQGCQLGLCRCFEFADLQAPVQRGFVNGTHRAANDAPA
jgi:hypothetical protein